MSDFGKFKMVDISYHIIFFKMADLCKWRIFQNGGYFKMADDSMWWMFQNGGFFFLNVRFLKW